MAGLHIFPAGTFLHHLPYPERKRLLGLGSERRFAAEQVLMRQGDARTPIFVLLDGITKATAPGDGHESLLAVRVAGDVIGDSVAATLLAAALLARFRRAAAAPQPVRVALENA
jgi:CRP/FNR family cyclic AMP-dependent transcriptional regulator